MAKQLKSSKLKKRSIILAVNILPILVCLFLGELYLRRIGLQPYQRTYPEQYQDEPGVIWVQTDSVLGWTVDPAFLPAEINPQGFRASQDFTKLANNADKSRVMIVGDSFTFGTHLAVEDSYASLMQAQLSDTHEVYNLGVPGYGVDQMALTYHQFKDLIEPDIVILTFIDDDIERVLEAFRIVEKLNKPSFTLVGDELIARPAAGKATLFFSNLIGKSVFFSYLLRESYFVLEAKPVVNKMLNDIEQDIGEQGGGFVVVRIPTQDQFGRMQTQRRRLIGVEDMLAGTRATYLSPVEEVVQTPDWKTSLYFTDGHLNEMGNQLLADYIVEQVFQ
ncbi:MAG: hypothetical protein ACI9EW_001095 [Cellvibrionaceae bacterium]|jgi:hypothetical protein